MGGMDSKVALCMALIKGENFMNTSSRTAQQGFTLIELMIVIAIMAIVLMLAIPAYQDYAVRAKITESLSVAASAKTSVTEACQTNPLEPPSNAASGYNFEASEYVASVVIGGTCAQPTVVLTTQNTGASPAPVVVLSGNFEPGDGRYAWTCTRTVGLNNMVPSRCRTT